jgi:tetratricopeptide (TPR) repeat protein
MTKNMQIKFTKFSRLLIFIFLVLFPMSCYSNYIHLEYESHYGAVYNTRNMNEIAFIASTSAYRSPTGISRFPDGGIPEYLFQEVFLYVLNLEDHKISKVQDLNDIADLIGTSKNKWKSKLVYEEPFIFYHISPVTDWSLYKKWRGNSISPEKQSEIQEKYTKYFKINVHTKEVAEIDPSVFHKMFDDLYGKTKISLTSLNKELKKTNLSEFNFDLKKIENKNDDEYIEETIYLKNDSEVTRRAVIEQIITKKSVKEIRSLLKKMDQYKNSLEGSKRIQYEISSEATFSAIRSLVEDNCKTLSEKAAEQHKKENYIESDELYRQAIDCDPKNPQIWNAFGEMNYEAGSINTADVAFTEALDLDPSFAPAWKNLGIMAIDNENFTRALKCLEKANKLDPADESITALLKKLKYQLGVVTEQDP